MLINGDILFQTVCERCTECRLEISVLPCGNQQSSVRKSYHRIKLREKSVSCLQVYASESVGVLFRRQNFFSIYVSFVSIIDVDKITNAFNNILSTFQSFVRPTSMI